MTGKPCKPNLTRLLAGRTVFLIETDNHQLVFDDRGTRIIQPAWPRLGTIYVSFADPADGSPRAV